VTDNPLLRGHVAVITGGSRGIGRCIASALAAEGATVVVVARNRSGLDDVVHKITDDGGSAEAMACDISDDGDVLRLVAETTDTVGTPTILVNNAGGYRVGPFEDAPLEDFVYLIEINYLSTVRMIKAFLPGMLAANQGRIINIASTAGLQGSRNQSMYNGSKHAVIGLTRCLGLEFATRGVRVNAICPGFVDTDLVSDALPLMAKRFDTSEDAVRQMLVERVPIGRFLMPDEISPLAVYLASPASDGVTGQAFAVDGGLTA
jgi:NAD(P)-dependent dehydrogenase (short-subunit alcohol dehydrogenase family)